MPASASSDSGSEDSSRNEEYEFNWLLFKRLGRLFRILFPNIYSPTVLPLVLYFVSAVIYEIFVFYAGLIPSRFMQIIVEGNKDTYIQEFVFACILIVIRAMSQSTRRYARCLLEMAWRKMLCSSIHDKYFENMNYYHINVTGNSIDNPDQRLTHDITQLVDSMGEVIADVMLKPIIIIYYSYIVYQTTGLYGIAISYVLIISFFIFNVKALSPIVRTTSELDKKEGYYRFHQMHIRVYAESIALQGSEKVEKFLANSKLDSVIDASAAMYWARYLCFTAMDLFVLMKDVIAFAIFAIPYFGGEYSHLSTAELSRRIGQNNFVVGYLVHMFTDFLDNTTEISEMASTTHRVAEFFEVLEKRNSECQMNQEDNNQCNQHSAPTEETKEKIGRGKLYVIKDLSVYPPKRHDVTKPVINNLNLDIQHKSNVLICGDGNCGKTSILRILKGLWKTNGNVWRSEFVKDPSNLIHLSQQPLLTEGSFRKQLMYPKSTNSNITCSDAQILRYIEKLNLTGLLNRAGGLDEDVDWNWYNILSPSEAQSLSIARLFYHRPKIVFLDDVLKNIESKIIEFIYEEFKAQSITAISVGKEETLAKYHHQIIRLSLNGSWTSSSNL